MSIHLTLIYVIPTIPCPPLLPYFYYEELMFLSYHQSN